MSCSGPRRTLPPYLDLLGRLWYKGKVGAGRAATGARRPARGGRGRPLRAATSAAAACSFGDRAVLRMPLEPRDAHSLNHGPRGRRRQLLGLLPPP